MVKFCGLNAVISIGIIIWCLHERSVRWNISPHRCHIEFKCGAFNGAFSSCKSMIETHIIYISAVLIYQILCEMPEESKEKQITGCHTKIYNLGRNIHCVFLSMQRENSLQATTLSFRHKPRRLTMLCWSELLCCTWASETLQTGTCSAKAAWFRWSQIKQVQTSPSQD